MGRLFVDGVPSIGVNFALGTTKGISIADNSVLRPETNSIFTWCAWVKLFNTVENVLPRILAKGSHYTCIMGDKTNGQYRRMALEVGDDNGSGVVEYWGTTRLSFHRWYFLATVFDTGTCQHYVNAVAETMNVISGPFVAPLASSSANALLIGNSSGNSRNWPGVIAGAKVFNAALTAAQILQLFKGQEISTDNQLNMKLNEGNGTSVADSSSNGFTGTITAAGWGN